VRHKFAISIFFLLVVVSIAGAAFLGESQVPKARSPKAGFQIFKGPVIKTIYSSLQVEVVIKDKRILDVIPLVLPNSDPKSIELAHLSVPILRNEAIHRNSATIQGVTGASVTSSAYSRSLQGALAQARL
jgi:hypothetical protein